MPRRSERIQQQARSKNIIPAQNSTSTPIAEVHAEMSESDDLNNTIIDPPDGASSSAGADQISNAAILRQMRAMFQEVSIEVRAMGNRMEQLERKLQKEPTTDPPGISASTSTVSGTPWSGSTSSQVSLLNPLVQKTFDLPSFSGQPSQWPMFIAAYRQSTAAYGYTALQNVFRLQKCLSGEARSSVESLLLSPDHLEELLEDLELRFGRPELLQSDQISKLREFPKLKEWQCDQLILFSSHVTNTVAFLNTEASRHILAETTLMNDLINKLPQSRKYEWLLYAENVEGRPTAIHFAKWLKSVAKRLSRLPVPAMHNESSSQRPNEGGGRERDGARRLLLNMESCGFCERPHKLSDCEAYRSESLQERWKFARQNRLCFGCLAYGHTLGRCNRGNNGFNVLLRHQEQQQPTTTNNAQVSGAEQQHTGNNNEAVNNQPGEATNNHVRPNNPFAQPPAPVLTCLDFPNYPLLFKVVPVILYGPNRSVNTFALFDEGSSVTLLDENTAEALGLNGPRKDMNLKWFGNHSTSSPSREVQLQISGADINSEKYFIQGVGTVRGLNLPTQSVVISASDTRHDHLRGIPIAVYQNATPTILIGLDNCQLTAVKETRINPNGGPIAAMTNLGWVVYGRQSDGASRQVLHCCKVGERNEEMNKMISEFYTTEHFGVKAPERLMESDEDMRARKILESTTVRIGGRYQTGLLWRSDDERLPDSLPMATQRYEMLRRKLGRDEAYARLYEQQMADYLSKGYARKLTMEEAGMRNNRTWFLPHFGVQSEHKPGKLRIVFDAAATVNGKSLNTALLKGPDLNRPLVGILLQFRMRPVGVCADVTEMFSQIVIQPNDRCAQRFLWRIGGEGPPHVYEMNVMTFGATCSPTSAQYTKNLNASEWEREFPEAAEAIRTQHYVDDFVASFANVADATRITRDVVEVHRRGGFVLRKFVSNSCQVLNELGAHSTDKQLAVNMQLDSNVCEKILGLRWNTSTDEFVFNIKFSRISSDVLTGGRSPTKREILSIVMSVFDPFGFLADLMLHSKTMVQNLWKLGLEWDVPIPDQINTKWKVWCRALQDVQLFRIPRCYSHFLLVASDVQLHCFADASEEAFAAVAYWRINHGDNCTVSFIAGKSKCAPLKLLSIPRLELQAAVLATRLHNMILEHHHVNISKTIFWTDSRTVMQWIQSTERRFRPFVAHRVSEVLDSTRATWWRWIPTKDNVADDATRSKAVPTFNPDSRWIRGPAFLNQNEKHWPKIPEAEANEQSDESLEEIRPRFVGLVIANSVINFDRFSSLSRLSRAVAWVLRFAHNARAKGQKEKLLCGELTATEVRNATNHLCRIAQAEGFPTEYAALNGGRSIDKGSTLTSLMPYLDEAKLMRLSGRTDAANPEYLPVSAQRPILLPKQHRLTELIVSAHHAKMCHQFEGGTICSVRREYWVPHLRALVRRIRRSCLDCKIRAALPKPPVAGQLPVDRLTPYVAPFAYSGVDYFGPIQVTVGRRREKRWICLFTCLTIRAIHMEIAADLSTDACLVCLRNFCNTRGVPVRLRSDCGTNFIGANHELQRMADVFDNDEIRKELSTKGIDWVFNCPANPEAGGSWERLVQSTKRVLAVSLKQIAPKVETLRSLIIEAANIINSRPLTDIPVSAEDSPPLTPNHFLLGRMNSSTTTSEFEPRQLCARKQWRILTQLKNHFWARWVKEYLPVLTRRTKQYEDVKPLEVGDLVLICDANQTRGQWLRGRIERVMPGIDGRVRVAEVRTIGGLLRRPVSKLAVLDICVESAAADSRGPGCRRDLRPEH